MARFVSRWRDAWHDPGYAVRYLLPRKPHAEAE